MSIDRETQAPVFPDLDPDEVSSNPSGNRPFRDVVNARLSRRDIMRGGTVIAAASFPAAAGGVLGDAAPAGCHDR